MSLRKAGYSVTTAGEASTALRYIDESKPDLIVSDTRLDGMDGFDFAREIKKRGDTSHIPFIFLSSDMSVESKVRGLELGVSDYLNKPMYIKEIITRVNLLLSRQQHESLAPPGQSGKTKFTGSLADLGLVDLVQTIDLGRKSGVLTMRHGPNTGSIFFADGRIVDAEVGTQRGEAAVYRALLWADGTFEMDFRSVRREDRVKSTTQAILMEGMRRVDEWSSITEQMPVLTTLVEVVEEEFYAHLADIPDEMNDVLKHVDGTKSLLRIITSVDGDDLAVLAALSKLYFDGLIRPVPGQTAPLEVAEPTNEPSTESIDEPNSTDLDTSGHTTEEFAGATTVDRDFVDAVPVRTGHTVPFRAEPTSTQPIETIEENTLRGVGIPLALPSDSVPVAGTVKVGVVDDTLSIAAEDSKNIAVRNDSSDSATDSSDTDDEDPMSKKGNKRKKQSTLVPGMSAQATAESNVILFPQKTAQVAAAGQVAVGGDVAQPTETPASIPPGADRPSGIESKSGKKNKKKRREESDSDTSQVTAKQRPENDAPVAKKTDGDEDAPKEVTTGSHAAIITGEHKAMADEFFRADAYNASQNIQEPETWDDLNEDTEVLPGQRRGIYATIVIGVVAAAVIIGIYGYNNWWMPVAEELGHTGSTRLPEPIAAGTPESVHAATQAATAPAAAAPAAAAPAAAAPTATAPVAAAPAEVTPGAAAPAAVAPVAAAPVSGDYTTALEAAKRARGRRQVEAYQAAIAINPAGSEALSALGFIFLNRGDNRQAADLAQRAVTADPTNSEGWITLGAARQGLRDETGAREAYRACVEQGRGRYVNDCRQMSH